MKNKTSFITMFLSVILITGIIPGNALAAGIPLFLSSVESEDESVQETSERQDFMDEMSDDGSNDDEIVPYPDNDNNGTPETDPSKSPETLPNEDAGDENGDQYFEDEPPSSEGNSDENIDPDNGKSGDSEESYEDNAPIINDESEGQQTNREEGVVEKKDDSAEVHSQGNGVEDLADSYNAYIVKDSWGDGELYYTGEEQCPEIIVGKGFFHSNMEYYYDDIEGFNPNAIILEKDVDYIVSYENNVNAGTALVKAVGIGAYTGEISVAFEIHKAEFFGHEEEPDGVVPSISPYCPAALKYSLNYILEKYDESEFFEDGTAAQGKKDEGTSDEIILKKNSFINPLIRNTDGEVSFSSSNPEIATVDAITGEVSIKGGGTTIITAEATEGTNYLSGSVSYTVQISGDTEVVISPETSIGSGIIGNYSYWLPSKKTQSGTSSEISPVILDSSAQIIYETDENEEKEDTEVQVEERQMSASEDNSDSVQNDDEILFWSVSKFGTLDIYGKGRLPDTNCCDGPWYSHQKLIQSVIIHDGIENIPNGFMSYGYLYKSLANLSIPKTVTTIGYDTFKNCELIEKITIPSSVLSIGLASFCNCTNLAKVIIPETTTSISDYDGSVPDYSILADPAFYGCPDLVIYGITGSEAERYANSKGIPFEALPDDSIGEDNNSDNGSTNEEPKDDNGSGAGQKPDENDELGNDGKEGDNNSDIENTNEEDWHHAETSGIYDFSITEGEEMISLSMQNESGDNTPEDKGILIESDGTEIATQNFYGNAVRLSLDLKNANKGDQYLVAVTKDRKWTDDQIFYINQAKADGSNLHFDVFPKELVAGTYAVFLLGGSLDEGIAFSDIKQVAAFSYYRHGSETNSDAYTISYVLDGGVNNPDNPTSYRKGDHFLLKDPEKTNSTFLGWYLDGEGIDRVYEIAWGRTGNLKLYAKWKEEPIVNKDISNAEINLKEYTYTFTGREIKPLPVVRLNDVVLESGIDFDVFYENHVNAGTATIKITGKGEYYGENSILFTITKASISNAKINGLKECVYTGKELTQKITVSLSEKTLVLNNDYTVKYSNNKNAGKATVIVTGKGNYSGEARDTFVIKKAEQNLTVKTTAVSVKVGKTVSIIAKGVGNISFTSNNTKVLTVNTKGIVTGRLKGSAYVTVMAAGDANYNSAVRKIKLSVVYPLSAPIISKVENDISGIKITWKKVSKAEKYRVYYKTGSGNWKKLCDSANTKYTWKKAKNGSKYSFTVSCISKDSRYVTSDYNKTGKSIRYVTASGISGLTVKSNTITVKWKKRSGITGYQLQYSTSKSFKSGIKTVKVKGERNTSRTIGSLLKEKVYYVRIRTYKTVSGVNTYSAWSAVKNVKTKK